MHRSFAILITMQMSVSQARVGRHIQLHSLICSTNLLDVIRNQASPVRAVVVDGVPIVVRLLSSTWDYIAQLPEQIRSHSHILQPQAGVLPLALHWAVVRSYIDTVLLQEAGLVSFFASSSVRSDPCVAPVIRCTPGLGVQVNCAEGDVGQREVSGKIETFAKLVGVRAIAGETEALVADGNHMVGVERADVVGRATDPVGQN